MTTKIKYFAIDPRGTEHTRNSARTYTHCVVAQADYAADLDRANSSTWLEPTDRKNHRYYSRTVNEGAFSQWTSEEQKAKMIAAAAMTEDEYVAHLRAERIARIEANRVAGKYDEYGVLGWCGRPDLAEKLANKHFNDGHNVNVTVLPAQTR
jgi:hypothetical protein